MDHPMDEPFDELMGSNPKKNLETKDLYRPSEITPDPSPTYSSTPTGSRKSSAPPANAFVHTSSQDRWSQYERDGQQLKRESDQAYATAVASAAERAARIDSYRSPPSEKEDIMVLDLPVDEPPSLNPSPDVQFRRFYDDPDRQAVQDRLDKAGSSLPPPEPRRGASRDTGTSPKEILQSLSRAAIVRSSSRNEEEKILFESPHDQVRAEALKVLEMADEKVGKKDFESVGSSRRVPAALAGLDFSSTTSSRSSVSRKPYRDDRFAIDDDDDEIHDVVEAERNSGRRAFDMEDEEDDKSAKSSWSSRYGNPLNSHLSALTGASRSSTTSILESYDRSHKREAKSAQNMSFNSSRSSEKSPSKGGVFGSGFSFRKNKEVTSPSQYNLQNHRTVWMDVDTNTSNGRSLPPPQPLKRSWHENIERKRTQRRRFIIAAAIAVVLAIIIGIAVGTTKNKGGDDSDQSFSMTGDGVGQVITFYVTADVPFDAEDQKKLSGDLAVIPSNANFVAHLGNIQDSSVTLCNEAAYTDASIVLQESPVPMFILPGTMDWNECANPDESWASWKNSFEEFESNFDNHFVIDRQGFRTENFSFVHRGVLFIGLHLIGGRVHDEKEWKLRHEENVQWVDEKLGEDPEGYRAVVLFGNARPSQQQQDFFRDAVRDIKNVGKPAVYIHADAGGGFQEHDPFGDADNFEAVQIDHGGSSPPLRVTVGFGSRPFAFGPQVPTS